LFAARSARNWIASRVKPVNSATVEVMTCIP
jgi:hypothetical protein